MGEKIIKKLLPSLPKMKWPDHRGPTDLGHTSYEFGIQKVDEYDRSNPQVLAEAIRIFQGGDSEPFAYGGVSYVLIAASIEKDNSYYQPGLDAALTWVEKAQETAADITEINVNEALIYIYGGRMGDARLVLDYLTEHDPTCFYLARTEIVYWKYMDDVDMVESSFERALDVSPTGPRRIHMYKQLAAFFKEKELWEKAETMYKQVVHFYRDDPRAWHDLSIVYGRLRNYPEAIRCNQQARKLGNFPEADRFARALARRRTTDFLLGRLPD